MCQRLLYSQSRMTWLCKLEAEFVSANTYIIQGALSADVCNWSQYYAVFGSYII